MCSILWRISQVIFEPWIQRRCVTLFQDTGVLLFWGQYRSKYLSDLTVIKWKGPSENHNPKKTGQNLDIDLISFSEQQKHLPKCEPLKVQNHEQVKQRSNSGKKEAKLEDKLFWDPGYRHKSTIQIEYRMKKMHSNNTTKQTQKIRKRGQQLLLQEKNTQNNPHSKVAPSLNDSEL